MEVVWEREEKMKKCFFSKFEITKSRIFFSFSAAVSLDGRTFDNMSQFPYYIDADGTINVWVVHLEAFYYSNLEELRPDDLVTVLAKYYARACALRGVPYDPQRRVVMTSSIQERRYRAE